MAVFVAVKISKYYMI